MPKQKHDCFVSAVPEKLKKQKENKKMCQHKKKAPVIASDGLWPLQIILHNTCALFFLLQISHLVFKKKKKKNETENLLSCLSLRFSLTHCGSFALMGAEPGTPSAGNSEVNAHWMAHQRPLTRSPVPFLL